MKILRRIEPTPRCDGKSRMCLRRGLYMVAGQSGSYCFQHVLTDCIPRRDHDAARAAIAKAVAA